MTAITKKLHQKKIQQSHRPPHVQLFGPKVIQEPEKESLDESPEDPGKHHHHKEHYNLRRKIVLQKGCRYLLLIVNFTTTRHSYL